jgi:hypothetical protein
MDVDLSRVAGGADQEGSIRWSRGLTRRMSLQR